MRKSFLVIFLCASYCLLSFAHAESKNENLSFIYNNENIVSWVASENLIKIRVSEDAKREFYELTRDHIGDKIKVFLYETEVSSPVINEAINSNSVSFALPANEIIEMIKLLPEDKRE